MTQCPSNPPSQPTICNSPPFCAFRNQKCCKSGGRETPPPPEYGAQPISFFIAFATNLVEHLDHEWALDGGGLVVFLTAG
uniref:Uncharacterized protein n=1 Tax=Ditylenchus dipsaci TaxID=166011 RepID=A0A915EDJ6_9BILA